MNTLTNQNPFQFGYDAATNSVTRQEAINGWGRLVGYDNALMDDCVQVVMGWKAGQEEMT
jgi:hypothetical protein